MKELHLINNITTSGLWNSEQSQLVLICTNSNKTATASTKKLHQDTLQKLWLLILTFDVQRNPIDLFYTNTFPPPPPTHTIEKEEQKSLEPNKMSTYLESTVSILPTWYLKFPGVESWMCDNGKNLCRQ